jgi:hypothetical protein
MLRTRCTANDSKGGKGLQAKGEQLPRNLKSGVDRVREVREREDERVSEGEEGREGRTQHVCVCYVDVFSCSFLVRTPKY